MTTPLDKTLKREVKINGRAFIVALFPEGLKLTLKGKRLGQELRWTDLISGDAALAAALNASLGQFAESSAAKPTATDAPTKPAAPAKSAASTKPAAPAKGAASTKPAAPAKSAGSRKPRGPKARSSPKRSR